MSVLIKDYPFPNDCYECSLRNDFYCDVTVDEIRDYYLKGGKPENCPLVDAEPRPPLRGNKMWQCPNCKRNLTAIGCVKKEYAYCPKCGTAIDWDLIPKLPVHIEPEVITWQGTIKTTKLKS